MLALARIAAVGTSSPCPCQIEVQAGGGVQGVDSHIYGLWAQILAEVVGHDVRSPAGDGVVVERIAAGNHELGSQRGGVLLGFAMPPQDLSKQAETIAQVLLTVRVEVPALLRGDNVAAGILVL